MTRTTRERRGEATTLSATPPAPPSYADELAHRARISGLVLAVTAAVLVPLWSVFDWILEPEYAATFLVLRLVCDVPVLLGAWLLWRHPLGRRRPALLTYAVLAVVQAEIAWMVVRTGNARELYLLGFSLALYACGCLLVGGVRWTAALVATTWTAFAIALLTAPAAMPPDELAGAAFYLGTASIIALLAHDQRARLTRRELITRERLEREQMRTSELLTQLDRLSHEDSLTGLANRRRWDARLNSACDRARRTGEQAAVILIDVDRFKEINDRHGHTAGDGALRHVAALLTSRVDGTGLVARLGGDEFGVLLEDPAAGSAVALAQQLRRDAADYGPLAETGVSLTLSLGVATTVGERALPVAVMAAGDRELYRAKHTRDTVCAADVTNPEVMPAPRTSKRTAPQGRAHRDAPR